uniref:PHD-type domain-containing protein n=1 Tax=Physcomitrium patens TaxID=3218 RepID=A0A2K1JBD1_PHYPA|nr:hypothetical protein PHYPA_019120 [Physcomitrium patens]
MLLYNQCQHGWHMACLIPLLLTLPSQDWICLYCKKIEDFFY